MIRYIYEQLTIRGAENTIDAFKKALDQVKKVESLRGIKLFDYYQD